MYAALIAFLMPSVLRKITSINCIFQSAMYILCQSYLYPMLVHSFLLSLSFPPYQSLPCNHTVALACGQTKTDSWKGSKNLQVL